MTGTSKSPAVNMPQGFLKLPAELGVLVMTHLETPRDLFAFVSTARPMWQMFQGNRAAILEAVIRNAIPHGNLHIAVAACAASQTSKLWWAKSSTTGVEESQDRFRTDFSRGYALDSSLCDWNLLVSLSKLWWISDYFLACFEQDALSFAVGKISQQSTRSSTSSERSRLQRAFLQFEIYRRITPNTMDESWFVPDAVYDRILDFLQLFPPWEREEVLSVQEFLVEFVKNMCRRLQDYIVLEISSVAKDMAAKSEASQGAFERESMARIKMGFDLNRLDVFEYDERRFQYFVARGLPFIRWLSNLAPVDQIEAIVHHSLGSCLVSLFEALLALQSQLASFDARMGWPDEANAGTLKGPNQGWMWAKEHGLTAGGDSLLTRYNLRRMGYVFWDAARLRDDWKLPLTSPSMLELPPRSEDDNDRDWLKEPGIEERFKDIPIAKDTFLEIDGGPYARLKASEEMLEKIGDGYPTPFSDREAEVFGIEY